MSSAPSQFFLYGHWHIVRTATDFANGELRLSKQLRTGARAQCSAETGARFSTSRFQASIGAGEGIRTLDPDLGKVVLYP